jgi:hypothetical protein
MVMMCLLTPFLLMPLVGLAIDASIARLELLRLQVAVDGAALGTGRVLGAVVDPEALALEFLKANFRSAESVGSKAGTWGAYGLNSVKHVDIVYTPGITKEIKVKARAMVPTFFLRVLRYPNVLIVANGHATRSDSRIVLVIDRSGSMGPPPNGNNVIVSAIANAKSFVGSFIKGSDEVGLVVFSGGAIVGYPSYAPGTWTPADAAHVLPKSASLLGPDSSFADGSATDVLHQLDALKADSRTNTSEALSMAYVELQKAHMRDYAGGPDDRTNAIVLLTDGVPTAVSLYANNPANNLAENALDAGSTPSPCTYNPYTTSTVPTAAAAKAAAVAAAILHPMYGWMAGSGNSPPYDETATTSSQLFGLNMIPSRDSNSAHTAAWWMATPAGAEAAPDTQANYAGCYTHTHKSSPSNDPPTVANGMMFSTNLGTTYTDLGKIPNKDYYGNAMNTTAYQNSNLTSNPNHATSIYKSGIELNQTKTTNDYHWGLAIWNAVDSAAKSILTDANYANRTNDDINKMKINIYVIGYTGNNGLDDGLLRRVANDKSAVGYDSTLPQGLYVPANDPDALAAAFNKVATALLRLSK